MSKDIRPYDRETNKSGSWIGRSRKRGSAADREDRMGEKLEI
jgi:hypothetical protein